MIRAAITAAALVAGVAHAAAPVPPPFGGVRATLAPNGSIAADRLDVVTEDGKRMQLYIGAPCPGLELSASTVLWQQVQSGMLLTDFAAGLDRQGRLATRVLTPDGEDVGALLITEGLAAPYAASAAAWCDGKYSETEGNDE